MQQPFDQPLILLGTGSYANVYKDKQEAYKLPTDWLKEYTHTVLREGICLRRTYGIECTGILLDKTTDQFMGFTMKLGDETLCRYDFVCKDVCPEQAMVKWFYQLCTQLARMHKDGIIHGDIKSNNIVLVKTFAGLDDKVKWNAYLCDFGLATVPNDTGPLYSVGFRPPEKVYGFKSDIWALGCSIWHAYLGAFYDYKSPNCMITPQTSGLTEALKFIFRHCLEEDVDKRWSAQDFLDFYDSNASFTPNVFSQYRPSNKFELVVHQIDNTFKVYRDLGPASKDQLLLSLKHSWKYNVGSIYRSFCNIFKIEDPEEKLLKASELLLQQMVHYKCDIQYGPLCSVYFVFLLAFGDSKWIDKLTCARFLTTFQTFEEFQCCIEQNMVYALVHTEWTNRIWPFQQ